MSREVNIKMKHIIPQTRASGVQDENGEWRWSPVQWSKCWCGMKHSNRHIPGKFWDRKWDKPIGPKLSAGVLLWKQNNLGFKKYFMIQSYNNCFGIPKGKVDPDETFADAAVREFYEETGTKIIIDKSSFEIRKIIGRNRFSVYIIKVPWDFEIKTTPISDIEINSYGFVESKTLRSGKFNLNRITRETFESLENIGHKV